MNHKTLNLTYMALGAVLIAVCSWISIPTMVPFTMQTFAVFLVPAALLGGKCGTGAILIYILLGGRRRSCICPLYRWYWYPFGKYGRIYCGLSLYGSNLLDDGNGFWKKQVG